MPSRLRAWSARLALVVFALVFAACDPNRLGTMIDLDIDLMTPDSHALLHFEAYPVAHENTVRRRHPLATRMITPLELSRNGTLPRIIIPA